jgi:hypothetical protein
MLGEQRIEPDKVTRPIQLLAAWLVGLICIDLIFLEAALRLEATAWERRWLIVAAILNVPAFLAAMFTLQTRFRAELQDDAHYARYLSKKTAEAIALRRREADAADDDGPTDFHVRVDRTVLGEDVVEVVPVADGDTPDDDASAPPQGIATAALDWHPWRVAMHAQLPRFAAIRAALGDAGIPVAEVFGRALRDDAAPPENWVVSINRALPAPHKAALLRALRPFGLDGFQLWRPVRDADESEDVYIGSYGVSTYARFTPELDALLAGAPGDADLDEYRRRHKVRDPRGGARASA